MSRFSLLCYLFLFLSFFILARIPAHILTRKASQVLISSKPARNLRLGGYFLERRKLPTCESLVKTPENKSRVLGGEEKINKSKVQVSSPRTKEKKEKGRNQQGGKMTTRRVEIFKDRRGLRRRRVRGGAGEGVQREFERWTQSNPS
jgi:hypothetical protein